MCPLSSPQHQAALGRPKKRHGPLRLPGVYDVKGRAEDTHETRQSKMESNCAITALKVELTLGDSLGVLLEKDQGGLEALRPNSKLSSQDSPLHIWRTSTPNLHLCRRGGGRGGRVGNQPITTSPCDYLGTRWVIPSAWRWKPTCVLHCSPNSSPLCH